MERIVGLSKLNLKLSAKLDGIQRITKQTTELDRSSRYYWFHNYLHYIQCALNQHIVTLLLLLAR